MKSRPAKESGVYGATDLPRRHTVGGQTQQPDCEPSEAEIEAAAKAWLSWQFPGRDWDTAVDVMKDRFRDGARVVLRAAASATRGKARDTG